MKRNLLLLAAIAITIGCSATGTPSVAPEPKTDEEKTFYALGLAMSRNLAQFRLTDSELELVKAGLTDGALDRPKKVELEVFGPKIQELAKTRAAAAGAESRKAGTAFLEKVAAEPGARKLPTGLILVEVKEGTGRAPMLSDTVKVHYTGTLTDGTVFDSSVERGQPATFGLGGVIPCWSQGLQLMKEGGKAKLYCPADLAYGDRGAPPKIGPGATLVFDVELLEIAKQGS